MRVARAPATRLSISRFALMVVGLVGAALAFSACTSGTDNGTAPSATRCGEPGVSFACGAETCSDALPVCCLYSNRPSRCVATGSICTANPVEERPQGEIECDDANDCGAGRACYRAFNKGTSRTEFFCGTPRSGVTQACKLSCECVQGKTCTECTCQ
jgi:hypothetical protein